MLHYSFVHNSLNHGIIVWGTATQNQLRKINVRMHNIVRIITWNKKFSQIIHMDVARIFDWGEPKPQIICNNVIKRLGKMNFL